MTTLAEARDGLARAINAGTGLRMYPYPTDTINAPCGFVRSDEFDPRMVLGRDKAAYPFTVIVYVGRVAEVAGQKKLDELREPVGGITSAVEDETNWNVTVDYAQVVNVGAAGGDSTNADDVYLTCEFEIEVCF